MPISIRSIILNAGLTVALLAFPSVATAQQGPADRHDAALAYAQCVRDNGYDEFPDPEPDGFRFMINPSNEQRFRVAAEACRELAPEGMRDEARTPEELEALVRLAQCMRENGLAEFPDPNADGGFDLRAAGIRPGDPRLQQVMGACRAESEAGMGGRVMIGG